jgi:hypothetical protein
MKRNIQLLSLMVLVIAFGGCNERTDRQEGSVILSVTDFTGLPTRVSATQGPFNIGGITVASIPKAPGSTGSNFQIVELRSYEVRYTRRDTGTRVPPPTVQAVFGTISAGSSQIFNNLGFLFSDQVLNQPLRDLRDFGVDRETGSAVVVLDVSIRFFGRTLSGDDVATEPARFTIEVTQ